ncbi:unnamed protein product [Amoebophrya sp. A25]|nr:unnamed protein product [Amoebophrya sp. A25]|eukprot:GSA25T00018778001.1
MKGAAPPLRDNRDFLIKLKFSNLVTGEQIEEDEGQQDDPDPRANPTLLHRGNDATAGASAQLTIFDAKQRLADALNRINGRKDTKICNIKAGREDRGSTQLQSTSTADEKASENGEQLQARAPPSSGASSSTFSGDRRTDGACVRPQRFYPEHFSLFLGDEAFADDHGFSDVVADSGFASENENYEYPDVKKRQNVFREKRMNMEHLARSWFVGSGGTTAAVPPLSAIGSGFTASSSSSLPASSGLAFDSGESVQSSGNSCTGNGGDGNRSGSIEDLAKTRPLRDTVRLSEIANSLFVDFEIMGSTQSQPGSWPSRCNALGDGAGRVGTRAVQGNGREEAMRCVLLFRYFVHVFAPFENRKELDKALEKGGYHLTNQEKSKMSKGKRRRKGKQRRAIVSKYGPIRIWDVSRISSLRRLFYGACDFNEDISGWNISGVEDMGLQSGTSLR